MYLGYILIPGGPCTGGLKNNNLDADPATQSDHFSRGKDKDMVRREITLDDALSIVRRWWPLLLALSLIGGGSGYAISQVLPKKFTSQTLVLVQGPTVLTDYVRPVVSDDINQRLAAMQQQILSRSRLEPVIKELNLFPAESPGLPTEELVDRLRKAVTISPIHPMAETRAQNLPGFTISVVFNEPRIAQQICSRITSMFLEENVQLRHDQAEQTTDFLVTELNDAKAKLDEQDAKFAVFKARYIGSLPDEEQRNLNILTGLTSQLEAATQTLDRAQQDKNFVESQLSQQLAAQQATENGRNPAQAQELLLVLQSRLADLQSKYTDDYPDVVTAKNNIAALKKKILETEELQKTAPPDKPVKAAAEPPQIQQLRVQLYQYNQMIKEKAALQEEVQKQIRLYQARVQSSPVIEQEYKQLTRDYQTALGFYTELLAKKQQSQMAANLDRRQQGEQFRVLDSANLPDNPSFPKMPLFVAEGFGGGLALGVGIIVLLEALDTSLKSERDVEVTLNLPVIAMIPTLRDGQNGTPSGTSRLRPYRSREKMKA
jgi:polysaccharide chain length determinant protein (PEP-CTERM system associated)